MQDSEHYELGGDDVQCITLTRTLLTILQLRPSKYLLLAADT